VKDGWAESWSEATAIDKSNILSSCFAHHSGKNAAMAAMSFIHSSTSHGLATCAMEGYDVLRVKEALRIPDRYEIPLMVSVGHSLDEEFGEVIWTNRLEVGEVFFEDTFGNTYDTEDDV